MPLSRTPGGISLEMIGCDTSTTMEDFKGVFWRCIFETILYARRMVRRGQSYSVDSKHSIDLKTQFVAHVLMRYSVLPKTIILATNDSVNQSIILNWWKDQ